MYSYEIDEILIKNNYSVTLDIYERIINSSQISRIKYDGFTNSIYIETTDGYNWKFKLEQISTH